MHENSVAAERPKANSRRKHVVNSGDRHGRLTVLREVETVKRNRRIEVKCDCGVIKVVMLGNLLKGHCRSCGCLCRELAQGRATHGLRSHQLYAVHNAMLNRCTNKLNRKYHRYGGRGISVCEEWRESCSAFIEFAMANGWRPGLEIDRRDNDGNYEPANCRFVTRRENMRNMSNNHMLTLEGKTKPVSEWSEETGIKYRTIMGRLRLGWSAERALTKTPIGRPKRMLTFAGKTQCLAEWVEETGLSRSAIRGRLAQGWSVERALTERVN